ncbi:MAG: hypothetical protein ABSA34_01180 [Candidatus Goldiibacteriota bacterium]
MKKILTMFFFVVLVDALFFAGISAYDDKGVSVIVTAVPAGVATAVSTAASPQATADLPTPAPTAQKSPEAAPTAAASIVYIPSPEAAATAQITAQQSATPAPEQKNSSEEKVNKIEIKNEKQDEGAVVLTPGAEPEKNNAGEDTSSAVVDKSAPGDGGVVLLTDAKEKMFRDHYILVERSGFISDNFTQDGVVYNLQNRESMQQGMYCYIKMDAGKSAKPGTEFITYTDEQNVADPVTGEELGNLVIVSGRGTVIEKADAEGIWKVRIEKNYNILHNNSKIKLRRDFKDYYNKVTTAVKKRTGQIQGFIILRQNGFTNGIKVSDIVFIDRGIRDGLLPGEKMEIFRATPNKDTGVDDAYNKLGTALVINVMKNNATVLITHSYSEMQIGDIVKTIQK